LTEAAILLEGVSFSFAGFDETVLKDVNLEIARGSFVLITGKSGSGKSTLARCLNGLIPHLVGGELRGRVTVDGKDVSKHEIWELAEHVALVFQSPASQMFALTVEEEVAFGPENLGIPRKAMEGRVDWALNCINAKELRFKPVSSLSDGEKQKVAVAANLSMLPDILVLDEPTSNLDPPSAGKLFTILGELNRKEGKTIVLIEHRTNRAVKYVDKVVIMDGGEIKLCSTPEILYNEQVLKRFGIRTPNFVPLPQQSAEPVGDPPYCPIIETKALSYSYGKEVALQDINVKINRGESVGIMGPNGSGKTTLVKLFVGLLKPTQGKVFVDGVDTSKTSVHKLAKTMSLILQNPSRQLLMSSVHDEIISSMGGMEISERRLNEILRALDLEELRDIHPQALSEGQKQRVVIATALARGTEALIFDEPTTGMDGYHLDLLVEKLNELRKEFTVIVVSHDAELITRTTNRVIQLAKPRRENFDRERIRRTC
jgi:energy-coupling factor transporter ATP-binding protein EcfA2